MGHSVVFFMELWVSVQVFTNLLVKGCELNLVVAGWWVVGLGRSGFGALWVVV